MSKLEEIWTVIRLDISLWNNINFLGTLYKFTFVL